MICYIIKKTFQLSTFKKNIDPMLKQFYYTFQQKKDEQKYNKNILIQVIYKQIMSNFLKNLTFNSIKNQQS
jgi:hypothetical protein